MCRAGIRRRWSGCSSRTTTAIRRRRCGRASSCDVTPAPYPSRNAYATANRAAAPDLPHGAAGRRGRKRLVPLVTPGGAPTALLAGFLVMLVALRVGEDARPLHLALEPPQRAVERLVLADSNFRQPGTPRRTVGRPIIGTLYTEPKGNWSALPAADPRRRSSSLYGAPQILSSNGCPPQTEVGRLKLLFSAVPLGGGRRLKPSGWLLVCPAAVRRVSFSPAAVRPLLPHCWDR